MATVAQKLTVAEFETAVQPGKAILRVLARGGCTEIGADLDTRSTSRNSHGSAVGGGLQSRL